MNAKDRGEVGASEAAAPVLHAVVEALVEGTGAAAGWLVVREHEQLVVRAATGDGTSGLVGQSVPAEAGTAGYVFSSGQPAALGGGHRDRRLAEGVTGLIGLTPGSVVCVPCDTPDGVIGALEAVEKRGAATFNFDDIELASLLAGIAGAALLTAGGTPVAPSPVELAHDLQRLADADASRYAMVASLIDALLARG